MPQPQIETDSLIRIATALERIATALESSEVRDDRSFHDLLGDVALLLKLRLPIRTEDIATAARTKL